jgi:hypothetical protein
MQAVLNAALPIFGLILTGYLYGASAASIGRRRTI